MLAGKKKTSNVKMTVRFVVGMLLRILLFAAGLMYEKAIRLWNFYPVTFK